MHVDILLFQLKPARNRIGYVNLRYYDLLIKCDLVYYAKEHKVWIRMPEKWILPTQKTCFCSWINKKISDEFQKNVISKIFAKFDLNVEKIAKLHKEQCERHRNKKKTPR
jgi:hypothetical protein